MHVFFRVDASTAIGSGHVMRCITLAEALLQKGAAVSFICRRLTGHYGELIETKGFPVFYLPPPREPQLVSDAVPHALWLETTWQQDAEETAAVIRQEGLEKPLLIVDHYALDYRWEQKLRASTSVLAVLDDLADRAHDCDILIDQSYCGIDPETRYDGLVASSCQLLMGPSYTLLRPQFLAARDNLKREYNDHISRLLIFFGGVDQDNQTEIALQALPLLNGKVAHVDVIVGKLHPQRDRIVDRCRAMNLIQVHHYVENIAELFAKADLAIGAGGTTIWERCCLGLPALVLSIAANQIKISSDGHHAGILHYLGDKAKVGASEIATWTDHYILRPEVRLAMATKAMEAVDGKGTLRVVKCLQSSF